MLVCMSEKNQKTEVQLKVIEMVHKEIIEGLNSQRIIISLFTAISAALISASASLYSNKNTEAAAIVLIASGVISSLLFIYWSGEFLKISRSSRFCWKAEELIKSDECFSDVIFHEMWLRSKSSCGKDNFVLMPYGAVQMMLASCSFAQVLAGAWILYFATENVIFIFSSALIIEITLAANIYSYLRIRESRKQIRESV